MSLHGAAWGFVVLHEAAWAFHEAAWGCTRMHATARGWGCMGLHGAHQRMRLSSSSGALQMSCSMASRKC